MSVLLNVFEGSDVAEGDVGARVARAVGLDGVGEGAGGLEEGAEVFADVYVEEGIIVVEEGDGAAIGGARFGDQGATALFGTAGEEASGEDNGGEALEVFAPFVVETGEDIEGVVFVADL